MTKSAIVFCSILLPLCACNRPAEQESPQQSANAVVENKAENPGVPEDRTPLNEPNGPIDPKSAEAAGQVVQSYGALIEQKRWAEANALWGDSVAAARFEAQLAQFANVHLEIGNPGELEGAAGSIYVTMPVIFYGDQTDGQPFRRSADVILRRINDVPGSTEAQRRWHIQRVDLAS